MTKVGLIFVLSVFALACGMAGGANTSSADKPLTVDEIRKIQADKSDEFKSKYLGKRAVIVGKVQKLPATFPGAFDTLGFQPIMLSGDGDARSVNCEVTEAEFAKFKDVKEGDVVTVTGTLKARIHDGPTRGFEILSAKIKNWTPGDPSVQFLPTKNISQPK